MLFPGCECLGQLSSWWELAVLHLLLQRRAGLLQLSRMPALWLVCAFSCAETARSDSK